MDGFCMHGITIRIAIGQRVDHPVCGFPKSVLLPQRSWPLPVHLAPLLVAWGIGRRQLIHISAIVGSRGQKCSANEAQVKVGAPGGPVGWAAVAGLRPEPQPGRLVCTCVSAG